VSELPTVYVLVRTDDKPASNQSFHRRADCGRMAGGGVKKGAREVRILPLEDAVRLPATELWGVNYGSLAPCSNCWPDPFVDGVFATGVPLDPEKVIEQARKHLL
jgi:hypothetical protein